MRIRRICHSKRARSSAVDSQVGDSPDFHGPFTDFLVELFVLEQDEGIRAFLCRTFMCVFDR